MRDADIRPILKADLERRFGDNGNSIIVNEFGIRHGARRIDLAVIGDLMRGFEIKSEKDNLNRLINQNSLYSLVFDQLTLVVSRNHVKKAEKILPEWWGITIAEQVQGEMTLTSQREAQFNPGTDPNHLVALLWREEALQALSTRGLDKGLRSAPRTRMWEVLLEAVPKTELQSIVRTSICARKGHVTFSRWA